jgi:hypothetical protein
MTHCPESCACPCHEHHRTDTQRHWEDEKLEWLIDVTKEAYYELLKDAVRQKLSQQVQGEVDQLADIASEKFTRWWQLKREHMALRKRFRHRFEQFCTEGPSP